MVPSKFFYVSPEDYLAGERLSPIKHEYRRGHVYAMVGAKKPHVILVSNIVTQLNIHLRESPCIVMASDIKVRLQATDCYYPDVVVTCDPEDLATTEDFILSPTLVIEVLSKSTEAFDRAEKFVDYQTCPTVTEYVLVSQTSVQLEVSRRTVGNEWVSQSYGAGSQVEFASLGFVGVIDDFYQKVPGLNQAA